MLRYAAALALAAAPAAAQAACPSIVEVASGDPQFSTLVSLVQRAGLVDALSDPQAALTLFAPTNDALAALDAATLASLDSVDNLVKVWRPPTLLAV